MLRQIGRFSCSAREFTKPRIPPDKQLANLINLSITNLAQSNTSKGIGNPEKVRLAVPASVQDISASGLKYLVSITAAGNKYRFSTLRALTSQTNDITLSCATSPFSAFRKITSISIDQKTLYANRDLVVYSESALSSVPYRNMSSPSPPLTALPLEKPSLYAAFPYGALHNTISFSIDQKTLYATRDLSYLKSAISSVPCRNMSSPSHPLTALPLEKPSLYAAFPYGALHNTISFSIDQKTLYATRDLSYLKSAISSVPCRNMSSPSHPLTALPLEKPSLYAAFPYNAVQNIMSFSIDQKTLYANRDLFFSDYVIYPMVLCRKVISTILKVSFPKDNVFTQCLACKVKSCI